MMQINVTGGTMVPLSPSNMLDAVLLFGGLGVVPAGHVAHQVAGDAADAAEGPGGEVVFEVHEVPVYVDVQRLDAADRVFGIGAGDVGVQLRPAASESTGS